MLKGTVGIFTMFLFDPIGQIGKLKGFLTKRV